MSPVKLRLPSAMNVIVTLAIALGVAGAVSVPAAAEIFREPAPALPPGDAPPPTAFSRIAEAGDAERHEGHDHVVVYETVVNRVDPRGVASTEGYLLYKVLTEAACRELSVLRWGFDPQSSWVDVREVNLLRDGKRISVNVEQVLDLPAPQAAIYWNDRIKLLQLPRLEVGDGIEVRTFRKGFTYALLVTEASDAAPGSAEPDDDRFIPPMPGEYFEIVIFQADVPVLEKRYELHLPPDKRLHSRVYNGALYSSTTYDDEASVYAWWGLDLPAAPHEPRQPDVSDYLTKVVVATVESWEAKSRWFFEVNESQFESTPEITEAVRAILDEAGLGKASEDEKAEALLHWVAQNIRYSGQTMGKGEGFTLHSGAMIFEQRSGVCKDIAGMLVTMLRAAGISAYPAMTMAGSRIEEVPADQFNHCVVARQEGDDWIMYDPTWVPYNDDIWSKLETEQHYLIGSPQGESLSRIDYSAPDESPLDVSHEARLTAEGALVGKFRFEGAGAMDSRLRRIVTRTPRPRLEQRLAGMLAAFSAGVEQVEVRYRAEDDFSGGMWIEVEYRAPGFALPVQGGLEFRSPMMALLAHEDTFVRGGEDGWPETRESDLLLWFTQRVRAEERVRLPRGFTADRVPESSEVDHTYAAFDGSAELEKENLVVRAKLEVRRRQIPAEGYRGFRETIEAARDWADALYRVSGAGTGE